MRWRRGASTADVIDVRAGGGRRRGGAALPVGGGLGVVGAIVFIAIQLLGGGAGGFNVPTGFDAATRAPNGEPIPPDQDPEAGLKDFSVYVFNSAQATWERTFSQQGEKLRARGLAWAYVIAHEVGHHVQQELGTSEQVDRIRREDPDRANEASVRLELQADCDTFSVEEL